MLTRVFCIAAVLTLAGLAAPPSNAAPATAPQAAAPAVSPATAPLPATAPAVPPAKPSSHAAAAKTAVFPAKVGAKYASQSAGQARMHTCLDQYTANKAANSNGGLKWIQKGGGYYSVCSKKLKG